MKTKKSGTPKKALPKAPHPVIPSALIPRPISPLPFASDKEYVCAFADAAVADWEEEQQVMARVACDEVEVFEYIKRSLEQTFSKDAAIKHALDAFGRRNLTTKGWQVYRSNDGWIFRNFKTWEKGIIHVTDRWTSRVLEKTFPAASFLGIDGGKNIPDSRDSLHFTPDQQAILTALLKPGDHSRDGLASAIDTTDDGAGVDESRITRAMHGLKGKKHLGLISRGFVTHGKASGYSLTPAGRKFAVELSS